MPQPSENISPIQHCVAKALYDNVPDTSDELPFRKGDLLIVIEQNTSNIEGWWLCSLNGRQGICPANRLRLIPAVFGDVGHRLCYDNFADNTDIHSLQRQGKRRSWHVHPNQVVTPKKVNDVFLYDMPPRCSPLPVSALSPGLSPCDDDDYDVPPRPIAVNNEAFRNCPRCSPIPLSSISAVIKETDAYDIPRSHTNHMNQLTPSSSASSLTADSISSSNRSSAVMPDYDTPPSRGPQLVLVSTQLYDVPSQTVKELPLELNSALENLERLQTDTTSAITKLLGFVGLNWRTKEKLENNLMEIKLAVARLHTSLHDLVEFGEGTLGNANKATDKNLAPKLAPLVTSLRRSYVLIRDASEKLNEQRWSVELLARSGDEEKSCKPDSLEQIVACSRALTEDIRQIASFIQGNGLLLFKKETVSSTSNNNVWTDDYDYIHLSGKDTNTKHDDIKNVLPPELQHYDVLTKHENRMNNGDKFQILGENDKQIIRFFAAQISTYHNNLTCAIDAFLQTVERNQPPKVFLAHGKFVVLSAHKLVHIGDTVYRNVSSKEIKERALNCANALSDALATSVNKTKQAALQFPSVIAVQEMVDSIVDISCSARDLKACLLQFSLPF